MTSSEYVHIAPHENPNGVYITERSEHPNGELDPRLTADSGCCSKPIYWMATGPGCSKCGSAIPVARGGEIKDEFPVIGVNENSSSERLRTWIKFWTGLEQEDIEIT